MAVAIFAAALICRIAFWLATPDRDLAWTAWFQGDAPLWLEYARAIESGQPFELGLPIHPPGAAWLVAALWNGLPSGIPFLRFAWAFLGALLPPLVFLAVERSFGLTIAAIAGAWTAISAGLLVLSTSVNNETPYLLLAVGGVGLVESLRERATAGRLATWSAVNAVACLFRVEHALFYAGALAFLAIGWLRRGPRAGARPLAWTAASLLFFVLPLVPWHLSAWGAIRRFNEEPRSLTRVEESAVAGVERATAAIPWNDEARRRRDELPAFVRRTGAAFVVATVVYRGGREIRGEDFGILEEAFGYFPRPLARFPFVSSYGPLNFYLANRPDASGGFDRAPLALPPPLAGGRERYPPALVAGLPPGDLSFVYPSHLKLFNEGYSLGARWIVDQPVEFARLVARKLSRFWAGAAAGFTGWNLPMGLSGRRGAVDMVVAESRPVAVAWRIAILAVAVLGLVAGRRNPALAGWVLFLASKLVVTAAFFGYARQGAVAIPAVAALAAISLDRWVPARLRGSVPALRAVIAVLSLAVAAEVIRAATAPEVLVDGQAVGPASPATPVEHAPRRVEVE